MPSDSDGRSASTQLWHCHAAHVLISRPFARILCGNVANAYILRRDAADAHVARLQSGNPCNSERLDRVQPLNVPECGAQSGAQ